MNSIGVTEGDEVRGLAPATAAIWTGLSDFINSDEAVSLLEQTFDFILTSFFLGHLGKSATLNILLKVETCNSNFGETFNSGFKCRTRPHTHTTLCSENYINKHQLDDDCLSASDGIKS